ncbi:MAG: hypothetical protein WCE66_11305 [Azonexus sp.]
MVDLEIGVGVGRVDLIIDALTGSARQASRAGSRYLIVTVDARKRAKINSGEVNL